MSFLQHVPTWFCVAFALVYLCAGVLFLINSRAGDVVAMLDGDGFPKTALALMAFHIALWPVSRLLLVAFFVTDDWLRSLRRQKQGGSR